MGIIKNGLSGFCRGKVGANYYYVMNNKQVVRAAPHIIQPRSEKQLAQQSKMAVISTMLNMINLYIRVGFSLTAKKREVNAASAAKSYNLKQAIKGTYPDFEIDYPKVRLTEGNLSVPLNPVVTIVNGDFKFTWEYDGQDTMGSPYDRTMLMAYFPEKNGCIQMISGRKREDRTETLVIADALKGFAAETYISFITTDQTAISNSVYAGRVTFD